MEECPLGYVLERGRTGERGGGQPDAEHRTSQARGVCVPVPISARAPTPLGPDPGAPGGAHVPEHGALALRGAFRRQGGAKASSLPSRPASPSGPSSGKCGSWPRSHLKPFQVLIVQMEGMDESFLLQKARCIN